MPPRAFGALLALAAALFWTVSLVTSAWWDGHPRVAGQTITAKTVHIGLLASEGCNTGGTGECQKLEIGSTFRAIGYGELGATGLAIAFVLLTGLAAFRISERRKAIAKVAVATTALAAVGAIVLVALGPDLHSSQKVAVPIGWGLMLFGAGVVASGLASALTMRVEREPLRLRPQPAAAPAAPDVRALLREQHDHLRPSARGPAPMLGGPLPPSPGGALPGPAGPLAPVPTGPAPLFEAAPQLRPLYEAAGHGLMPVPPAPLPQRAPTPMSRSAISALGLPTPPPLGIPTPPPPGSQHLPPGPGPGPAFSPRPVSPPAASPPAMSPPTAPPPPARPPAPRPGKSLPPPIAGRTAPKPLTMPPPVARPKAPSVAPPAARSGPTISHTVPPMPADARKSSPPGAARDGRHSTEADDRLETAMRDTDFVTAVEVDAEAKAAAVAARSASPRPASVDPMDATATGVEVPTAPDPGPLSTAEERALVSDDAPRGEGPIDPTDEIETAARERFDADELGVDAAPREAKVPISTAPASLPPPTVEVATAGPTPACPQCEAPMAWVEEHLRFYCKQCRMYF